MEKQGFSLVELSIVLVILGLLTGGILTGQNLIRAAELRSVTTEIQTYQTAVMTFRDEYFYLPGDMPNATDFWGAAASGSACKTTASTGTETCNGDGDGILKYNNSGSDEVFRFWQHLANAGLIEGRFTGVKASTNPWSAQIGLNVPRSRIGANSGWFAYNFLSPHSGNAKWFDSDYGNALWLGGQEDNQGPDKPVLTPEEAWNIDTKMDDGAPAQGRIWAGDYSSCTTAINSADRQSSYALNDSSIVCRIIFPEAF